jgi:RNA polymerase sigma factor (sigma-70 family)
MSIALRYAKDNAEAADIVSIAFVNAFKGLHTFNAEKGNFLGWLNRIVINEAIDFIKQFNKIDHKELTYAEETIVYNETIKKLDAADIMLLVKQLPRATHAVFMLYAIDGFKHKEIAQILNISEGTSKWHLNDARKNLQKKLEHLK